jgi:hypothetical protein
MIATLNRSLWASSFGVLESAAGNKAQLAAGNSVQKDGNEDDEESEIVFKKTTRQDVEGSHDDVVLRDVSRRQVDQVLPVFWIRIILVIWTWIRIE